MSTEAYAAASVTLLDRDTGDKSVSYFYPITRVELCNRRAEVERVFVVAWDGTWREEALA